MSPTRRRAGLATIVLALVGPAWASGQTPPHYTYDPRNPYVPPALTKPPLMKTAKDYWREKRDALKTGRPEPTSAAVAPTPDRAGPTVLPGTPTTELPPPPTIPPTPTPPPVAAPSATTTAPPEVEHVPRPEATIAAQAAARLEARRETASYESFLHRSLVAILREVEGKPWADDGSSPEVGFSPAGLVRYAFGRLGYAAPAGDVDELWQGFGLSMGSTWGDFAPGDILFFRLYSKSEQAGKLFVAIVVDEDTMAYPSYTRRKVVLRTFHDAFWRERFVGARRVFVE